MCLPSVKSAPIWLPIAFLLRDIAAWIYVFSYEPGITEKAVRIHHFLLIPGVFFGVEWSTVINIAFGIVIRLLVLVRKERYGGPSVQGWHASRQICGAPTLKLENPFQRASVVCNGVGGQLCAGNSRYGCLSPHLQK